MHIGLTIIRLVNLRGVLDWTSAYLCPYSSRSLGPLGSHALDAVVRLYPKYVIHIL
jgi:hypothetical protein